MGHCRRKFSTPLHTGKDEAGRKRGSTTIADAHLQPISRSGSTINIDLSALDAGSIEDSSFTVRIPRTHGGKQNNTMQYSCAISN